jgi:hypothetical protein
MKNLLCILFSCLVVLSCQSKKNESQKNVGLLALLPATNWKSAENNKFPLYYQFTDTVKVLIRDDSVLEVPNTYESSYQVKGDTIFIEVINDIGGSGVMNGYKQTLVYQNNTLLLVSDQMPNQKPDVYATADKFIKE